MVKVSKEEVSIIKKRCPNAHITILNRQHNSKAKKYFVEEASGVMRVLHEVRNPKSTNQKRR